MSGPAFITFDLDGVLVSTEGLHDTTFMQALCEIGFPHLAERYAVEFPGSEAISTRAKLLKLGVPQLYNHVKAAKDVLFSTRLNEVKFSATLAKDLARVRDTVAPIVLVTNCTRRMAGSILRLAGIHASFNMVISPCHVSETERTKPDPWLYQQALSWFQLKPSDHWLAFEDSDAGIAAALAASTQVVVCRTNYSDMQERLRKCEF